MVWGVGSAFANTVSHSSIRCTCKCVRWAFFLGSCYKCIKLASITPKPGSKDTKPARFAHSNTHSEDKCASIHLSWCEMKHNVLCCQKVGVLWCAQISLHPKIVFQHTQTHTHTHMKTQKTFYFRMHHICTSHVSRIFSLAKCDF